MTQEKKRKIINQCLKVLAQPLHPAKTACLEVIKDGDCSFVWLRLFVMVHKNHKDILLYKPFGLDGGEEKKRRKDKCMWVAP